MSRSFLNLFIFILLFVTNIYAATQTKSTDLQSEINSIKVELEKIKLTQHYENRDDKFKDIESNIKDLENKLNSSVIDKNNIQKDFQKYDEIIKRQDSRIGDLALYLTIFGTLLTVIVIFFAFKYESIVRAEADKEVKAWIDEKAEKEFQPKIDEYIQRLEDKSKDLLTDIQKDADDLNSKHRQAIDDINLMNKDISQTDKDLIDKDVEKLGANEQSYTFNDWHSKFLQQYFKNAFEQALGYINKALEVAKEDTEIVQALVSKGITLGELGKSEESIKEYDKVIEKFSETKNEKLLEQVVSALINKGAALGALSKNEEAIKEYDKVIEKFSEISNEKILEWVAKALVNKGLTLGALGKSEEEMQEYDKVIEKFSESKNEKILEVVKRALDNKSAILKALAKEKK